LIIKLFTHEEIKELYLEKAKAIENKNLDLLNKLRDMFPELFDKTFMYQFLQTELKNTGQKIPEELDILLQSIVKHSKKIKLH
jgi:hypothetical protein